MLMSLFCVCYMYNTIHRGSKHRNMALHMCEAFPDWYITVIVIVQ
jgi:hypothetical protein